MKLDAYYKGIDTQRAILIANITVWCVPSVTIV